MQIDKITALKKAQNICAKQEKCKSEIRQKLYEWKVNLQFHDSIIDSLGNEKFIDESRFAGFYVRDKFKFNKWGKVKIEYELKLKQIPATIISEAMSTIDDIQYSETCKSLLSQKLRLLKDNDSSVLREKLVRFGYSKGFEPELLFKLAENLIHSIKKPEK